MRARKTMIAVVAGLLALSAAIATTALAQDQNTDQSKKIKHVAVQPTSPASGEEMYKSYCAVCHGAAGKGNGPAASALKVPPSDLSTLTKRNGGKYPALKVQAILRGEQALPAHGTAEMPIWGDLFRNMASGHEGEVQQRISNLTTYLDSLQKQ